MIPAISNIAWPPSERAAAYAMMREQGVSGLEIAPGLFFAGAADPFDPEQVVLDEAMQALKEAGLRLVAMQSLTFGAKDIALFGNPSEREGFKTAMRRVIGLAGRLSIPAMVFGSPAHRVIGSAVSRPEAVRIAADTFAELAEAASRTATRIALEMNPTAYGTDFMTDLDEAFEVITAIDHPAVGLNLDLGALIMNGDTDELHNVLDRVMPHLVHVHVSAPHLAPAPSDRGLLDDLARGLADRHYDGAISIEMRPAKDEPVAAAADALNALTDALHGRRTS